VTNTCKTCTGTGIVVKPIVHRVWTESNVRDGGTSVAEYVNAVCPDCIEERLDYSTIGPTPYPSHAFLDSIMLRPSFFRCTLKQTLKERLKFPWNQKHKWNGELLAPRGYRWETDDEFRRRIHLSLPSMSGH
jgi:hypothetical protein